MNLFARIILIVVAMAAVQGCAAVVVTSAVTSAAVGVGTVAVGATTAVVKTTGGLAIDGAQAVGRAVAPPQQQKPE